VDELAAFIALRVVGGCHFPPALAYSHSCTVLSSQSEARGDKKEMSQTLLTNKKQGDLDEVHTANIIANVNLH
jgi:hypothetical protein